MLSDLTLKGSCHSGCFDRLGMIGLVPMPLFQRRSWCAEVDLHALYGIEYNKPELSVEDVEAPDLVE